MPQSIALFRAAGKPCDAFLTLESRLPNAHSTDSLIWDNPLKEMTMAIMNNAALAALTLLAAAGAFAQAAGPAPLAREGTYEQTLCFGGSAHVINASDTDRYGTYQTTGGTQSATKAFDSLSLECIGTFEMRSSVYKHKGYCLFQDASGDKFYGTDTATPQGYTVELLGGTGKFKGMTGVANVERLGAMAPVRQGTMQACRRVTATYKLP
jgi:hypothetical protein